MSRTETDEAREVVALLEQAIADGEREQAEDVQAAIRAGLEAGDHSAIAAARDRSAAIGADLSIRRVELTRARLELLEADIAEAKTQQASFSTAARGAHDAFIAAAKALEAAQEAHEQAEGGYRDAQNSAGYASQDVARLRAQRAELTERLEVQINQTTAALATA